MVASNRDGDVNALAKAILHSFMPGQVDATLPVATLRFLLETITQGFHAQQVNRPWMIQAETAKKAAIAEWATSATSDVKR